MARALDLAALKLTGEHHDHVHPTSSGIDVTIGLGDHEGALLLLASPGSRTKYLRNPEPTWLVN